MRPLLLWFLALSLCSLVMDFKTSQLRYTRVQQAYKDKNRKIDQLLNKNKILRLAVEARNNGEENIRVHIFPCPLTDEDLEILENRYKVEPAKLTFWRNLEEGFGLFEKTRTVPFISIAKDGTYHFSR